MRLLAENSGKGWRGFGFAVLIAATLSPLPAHAELVVNFGGDYGAGSGIDLQGKNSFGPLSVGNVVGDTFADSIGGRPFDTMTPLNPAGLTPDPGVQSEVFYGGAITIHSVEGADATTAQIDEFEMKNGSGGNDEVHMHLSSSGHLHDLRAIFYWKKSDFLNGYDINPFAFDPSSSVFFDLGPGSAEAIGTAEVRLLVQDGGSWYLSETAFTNPGGSNKTFTWDNANQGLGGGSGDGNWASYDPTAVFPLTGVSGTDLRFDQAGASFTSQQFTDIQAIGFLFENDVLHNNMDFHFQGFQVLAVIPEPSTILGIWGLLLGALARRRRRSLG